MATTLLLVRAIVLSVAVAGGASVLSDGSVAQLAFDVLRRVKISDEFETAAFVVRANDGGLRLVHWPARGDFRTAHWSGPLPAGTLAIIHTHPTHIRLPSRQDRLEANRLRLPFYVVSRNSLCVARPFEFVRCADRVPWLDKNGMIADVSLHWSDYPNEST